MAAGDQYQQAPQQDYRADSYRGQPPATSTGYNQRESSGLPNFDAIPTNVTEKSEANFIAGQKPSFDQNVYRRPTYQTPAAFPGKPEQIDTRGLQQSPPNQTTSPLAEFSFDLPASTRPTNAARNGYPAQAAMYQGGRNEHIPGSRAAPSGYGESQPQEIPGSHYPPRAASRNGVKLSMENDASRPPLPNNGQPYRSFSQDNYPQRPHTSNAQRPPQQSYEVMNPYDQDYTIRAPSAPAVPVPFEQGFGPPGQNTQYQQPYAQGTPIRKASQDSYNQNQQFRQPYGQDPLIRQTPQGPNDQGLPKSNGINSAHPVPVRHYGPTPNAEINPDALPAHPTPVRSGLSNGNSYQPTQSAPAQTPQRRDVSESPAPVTLQELNSLRQMYSSTPGDHALGLKLAKKMVEAAKVLSDENGTADAKTAQKNREKYIFDAHKLIKKLVSSSYPDAMFYLADCYGQGMLGLAVDAKEAFTLYQSAAKLNHPQSAYRVAVCCELGSEEGGGTRRDPLKAMQWYKRAATLGDTPAMYKMGMILLKGLLSQQKNPREAVSWLKRAAERADKDNPHALHELGLLYESATPPDNILRDERYALQLFQQAAELGYKYSQFRLGSAYEYGLIGCPIDARQSIAWYTRAAAQGEHQSELALSGWYLTGSEPLLTQSDTEAFLWARKAASSGLAKAEYAMGYFNEVGIGTAVDVEEAKRWYYRAACEYIPPRF
jgi:TPR repeat protein